MIVDKAIYVNGLRHPLVSTAPAGSLTWIGLYEPTADELTAHLAGIRFDPLALDDALAPRQRPKLDEYPNHSFLVLRTVHCLPGSCALVLGQVGIFFDSDCVITVRHGDEISLASTRSDLETKPDQLARGSGAVVYALVDQLVDEYEKLVVKITDDVMSIEDLVFNSNAPADPQRMYDVKREVIEFRRAVQPLVEPLTALASGVSSYVDDSFRYEFADVKDHLLRVVDALDSLERLMDTAFQANLALIAVKQDDDVRRISAWVGMAAVPTVIAGIYGMNFSNIPELNTRFGYFAVIGVMAVSCAVLFGLFRRRKWL